MSDHTKQMVFGLDLGDKRTQGFGLDRESGEITEFVIPTTRSGIRRIFSGRERARVALETGTHSPWLSQELEALGHEVIVANARQVALIHRSDKKSDRVDAERLCRLADYDPQMLHPIRHRGQSSQADLAVMKARNQLVEVRTKLILHVQGMVKSFGERLKSVSARTFAREAKDKIPKELAPALGPVLETLEGLTETIKAYDRAIAKLCKKYPETAVVAQVTGVGPVTSLGFVLTIEEPRRFGRNRDVAPYLGLVPRRKQSGKSDPELRISRAGDRYLRVLLVQSAHYILGPFGPDSDLRRWGFALASRGGKNAKKRAAVAVARKLSVLLLSLWKSGAEYEPLRHSNRLRPAV